jgi:hypothetical protein
MEFFYYKVRICKHLNDMFPLKKWSKSRRCFIDIAFQICFRISPQKGPGNCLQSCSLANFIYWNFFAQPLLDNGSTCHNVKRRIEDD